MSRDLKYALRFVADDKASPKIEQLNKVVERGSKKVEDQARKTSQEVVRGNEQAARSHEKTAQVQERAAQRGHSQATRMYQDRERLGIRSEDRIRREIALTEAAYRRLAQSGRLSGQEQARAYQQMQGRVAALRKELQATNQQQSALGRMGGIAGNVLTGGAQIAGAAVGAYHVMAQPVKRTMDYEQRLAYMANTAFAGEGLEAKKAGREELRAAIANATKYGGSREDAADALDSMIASGALPKETAINLLPELQKAAIATNSTTAEMGAIAVRAMQNFKVSEKDIPLMLDIAAKAGEAGGFEIKDMARWLPELMAAASTSGMGGIEDFKTLVTAAQASLITAGSTDAGGNNLKNLLLKINSQDTSKALEKIEIAPGKSVDLSGTLAKARGEGKSSLDAFVGIVDSVIGGNKEYQELTKKIQSSEKNSPEQKAAMEAQAALLQGSSIGQVIRDQQALLALVGYMNNREYVSNVRAEVDNAAGTNDENYQSVSDTAKNKSEKLSNIKQDAEYDAYKDITAGVGDAALKLAEYAAQYPQLTSFMLIAKDALSALAVAAGAATAIGGISAVLRGGRGAAAAGAGGLFGALSKRFGNIFTTSGTIAPAVGAKFAAGASSASATGVSGASVGSQALSKVANLGGSVGSTIGRGASYMHAIEGALGAISIAMSDLSQQDKNKAYTDLAIDTAVNASSAWMGAKAGAAIGSFAGPIGTAVGGVLGAIAGPAIVDGIMSVGGDIANAVSDWWSDDSKEPVKPQVASPIQNRIDGGYTEKDSAHVYNLAYQAYAGRTQAVTADNLPLTKLIETITNSVSTANQVSPEDLKVMVQYAVEQGVQSGVEKARQTPQELSIHTTVDVKQESIVATVNAVNRREARRN